MSELCLLSNESKNSPATGALCTHAFRYVTPLPFKTRVLGEKKAKPGPLPPAPATAAGGHRASKKEHLDWNRSVVILTPALLLKAFPSRNIQSPEPFKEGRACNAPCLADSPGQPKGSGRLEASLPDCTAPRVSLHSRVQPAAPLGILGLALRTSPRSLVFPLWLDQGRQVSLGHHCLSLSLSPGALRLRPSSEVLGQSGRHLMQSERPRFSINRGALETPPCFPSYHSVGVRWTAYLGQDLYSLLHHRTWSQRRLFIFQRERQSNGEGKW